MKVIVPSGSERRVSFRATLHKLPRDVGLLALGLTVIYGISGIAVNHKALWNPHQSIHVVPIHVGTPAAILAELTDDRRRELAATPTAVTAAEEAVLVEKITATLRRQQPPREVVRRDPEHLNLAYQPGDRDTVVYHATTGIAETKVGRDRFMLRAMNYLHLNHGRRFWPYVADAYALALVFLGLSGLVMLKGHVGRRAILVGVGAAVPLLGLLLLRWSV